MAAAGSCNDGHGHQLRSSARHADRPRPRRVGSSRPKNGDNDTSRGMDVGSEVMSTGKFVGQSYRIPGDDGGIRAE